MKNRSLLAGAALLAGVSFAWMAPATAAPLGVAGSAVSRDAIAAGDVSNDLIVKTQGRRGGRVAPGVRGGGAFAGGGRVARGGVYRGGVYRGGVYRGGVYRGGGWGYDPGAAAAVGIIGGVIGAMGAAAAADSGYYYPAPAPVYGGCYWVRQPAYDSWGNYLGRRRVQVCN